MSLFINHPTWCSFSMPVTRQRRRSDKSVLLPGIPMDEKRSRGSRASGSSLSRVTKPSAKKGNKVFYLLAPCIMTIAYKFAFDRGCKMQVCPMLHLRATSSRVGKGYVVPEPFHCMVKFSSHRKYGDTVTRL